MSIMHRVWRLLLAGALTAPLVACQLIPAGGPSLEGTIWQVTELHGEPFAVPGDRPFFLRLRRDGRFSAYAGCNALGGTYSRDGSTLRVGPFDSLTIICAPPQMVLEHAVMMAMEGASSYTLAGGVLRLRNPIGTVLIGFRPLRAGDGTPAPAGAGAG